jgi:hypothetical protein
VPSSPIGRPGHEEGEARSPQDGVLVAPTFPRIPDFLNGGFIWDGRAYGVRRSYTSSGTVVMTPEAKRKLIENHRPGLVDTGMIGLVFLGLVVGFLRGLRTQAHPVPPG